MEITIYREEFIKPDSIDNFLDFYYSIHMEHLASDLLIKGLSPKQISDAVVKAIKIGKSSGVEIREHFLPLLTEINHEIMNDCKLSHLGYGLVLMNADVDLSVVGKFQVDVLKGYLDTY